MVEQLTSLDHLRFELNGERLDAESARVRYNYNDCWLDFAVTEALKKGWNDLSFTIESRNPYVEATLSIRSVEVLIRYGS